MQLNSVHSPVCPFLTFTLTVSPTKENKRKKLTPKQNNTHTPKTSKQENKQTKTFSLLQHSLFVLVVLGAWYVTPYTLLSNQRHWQMFIVLVQGLWFLINYHQWLIKNSSVVTSLSNYFYERFLLYIFIAFKINDSYVKEKVAGHGGVHP